MAQPSLLYKIFSEQQNLQIT